MKKILVLTMILVVAVATKAMVTTPPGDGSAKTTYTLTVSKVGNSSGSVTSNVGSAAIGKTVKIKSGTSVVLSATTTESSTFSGWTGACSGKALTCTLTMNSNKTAIAVFTPVVKLLNGGELSNVNSTCAATAITKRDATVIAAEQKHSTDIIATWNARTAAQKLALAKTGSERMTAFRAAQATAKSAQQIVNKTYATAKQNAASAYRLEMRACGFQDDSNDDE
ncbi:hypothetical protein H7X65_00755 [Candidatus Parcubacteria bacterium]|nr:hypothetical protein [Candidatus Parcubacteria bacterium]